MSSLLERPSGVTGEVIGLKKAIVGSTKTEEAEIRLQIESISDKSTLIAKTCDP